jgi:hypothetical protein
MPVIDSQVRVYERNHAHRPWAGILRVAAQPPYFMGEVRGRVRGNAVVHCQTHENGLGSGDLLDVVVDNITGVTPTAYYQRGR